MMNRRQTKKRIKMLLITVAVVSCFRLKCEADVADVNR